MKIRTKIAGATLVAGLLAAAVQAQSGGSIAGTWTQRSNGKELVLVPKIKLQPNVGVGMGTSLGGSVGYGSMTRTAIVTEPTMLDVERTMKLEIQPNGSFTWATVTEHADGANCVRMTRRDRHGRATRSGSTIRFAIAGGEEKFAKSCGGTGSSAIPASTETYQVSMTSGRMRLTSGPSVYTFTAR